jgi:long-chain acyl-CoA synthetase
MEEKTGVALTMSNAFISLPGLIAQRGVANGTQTILRSKHRGIWHSVSWGELDVHIRHVAAALIAARIGRGDVVAILSETRPETVYTDLAVLGCGAASLAIDPDEEPDRVRMLLASTSARVVFVENEEQLDKVLLVRDACPDLGHIVIFDMKGLRELSDAMCTSLPHFADGGEPVDWEATLAAIEPNQPAIVLFPRGDQSQVLTHGDLMHMTSAARKQLPINPRDERLAASRLSNITERVWGLYLALEVGCVSNYPESPATVLENLRELQPTVLGADAIVWDRLSDIAATRAASATAVQRSAYRWAIGGGASGGPGKSLVLRAVRREFGLAKLRLAYVGGVSPTPAALDWARSLGVRVQRIDEPLADEAQSDTRYRSLTHAVFA